MTRADYIALVEDSYFGSMTRGDLQRILALFSPDARITTFYGDTPARRISAVPVDGEEPLTAFFAKAIDNFDVRYSDFEHVVDTQAQRIWSMYTLHIAGKPGGAMKDVPPRTLRNCNFFELEDGKIMAVTAYFANPPSIPVRGFGKN